MKKFNFKWLLLSFILSIASINTALAQCSQGQVFYFRPSTSNPDWTTDARFAVCFQDVYGNSSYESWYSCIEVPGDAGTYYAVAPAACYKWFFCRMKGSDSNNNWSNPPKWNQSTQLSWDGTNHYNLFTKKSDGNWDGDCDWSKYAPPMSSATLSNTSTIYGGDGTSGNPYKIKKGTTLSVSASATPAVDGGYTKYYQFYKKEGAGSRTAWGSRTTTSTASVTASNTVGVTYEIDVVAQNEYYSTYGTGATSSKMYFITEDPIYAILGDFNSWSRSAATWDLVDQGSGSNNWDATFTLTKGTYEFKVVHNSVYYGKGTGESYTTLTRASNSVSSLAASTNNLKLTADVTGSYTFRFNSSTKNLTVTFQPAYTVTFGKGTGGNTISASATSAGGTISSGAYVASGDDITFSQTAKSGYTFKGWYDASSGGTAISCMASDDVYDDIAANIRVYAQYTEDMHDVTVEAGDNGTVDEDEVTVGIDTKSGNITATPDPGYYFTGWTIPTGVTAAAGYTASSNPIQIKATADSKTITANFAPIWRIACSDDGYNTTTKQITNITTSAGVMTSGYVEVTLAANTDYEFKVFQANDAYPYWGKTSTITKITYANKATAVTLTHNSGNNQTFRTAAAGTYRFTWDVTGKITITYPTSYLITSGVKTVYDPNVSNTSDATETGGNVTAEDNSSNTITTGQYVADGANVTFTAHPATGYAFKGWYQNADCTTPYVDNSGTENTVVIDAEAKTLTLKSIAADKAVYAKYEEIMTRIAIMTYGGKFRVDAGDPTETYNDPYLQVGVKTTHTVSIASEDAGHYFSNWELSAAEDEAVNFSISGSAEDEDNRSITITGLGVETRTHLNFLEPKFKQLESIYFRNIFDDGETVTHWENVYVCFDITWADYAGKQAAQTSTYNTSKNLHVQMEGGSNYIYRAYVPRYITRNNKSNVAFVNYDPNYADGTGNYLYNGIACSRGDYSPKHNMFVPYHEKSYDANNVAYYNSGYWMHYSITSGVDAGYWIERHTGTNTYSGKPADQFVIVKRAYEDNPSIQYRLRIDGLSNDKYAIFSEGGLKYKAASTITHSACDGIEVVEDNSSDAYFVLTPTAEGEYIITLDQSGDKMKISVEYPVVIGDYVIENAYNDGSDKTTRSNIIKASSAGTKTRYSMYLNNAGSGTLKLRKCTSIDGSGNPVWSAGSDANLQAILNDAKFTKGVYQFDIAVSGDAVSEVDNVRLYTGNFYIKTDAAPGGWVAYKQNILDKNTVNFDRTSATYDNYFCKYFESKDWNIKSVIANDYCNQLSDTVKGDGIARMVGTEPYVPVDGTSIRFSYNSATNETKRAYLGASNKNDFLNLVEDQAAEKVYRKIDATTYDLHNISGYDNLWKTKFADNGNWVYQMELKVKPSAQAGVSAAYTDASKTKHDQVLIPSTNTVLGGSSSSTNRYSIRIVYDFKTNFMMSSFVLTEDPINENLSDFDMLWVRHKDNAATQLNLGDNKKLTNVRVVGAIELRYDSVNYYAEHSGHWVDLSTWNPQTRPFLKYFVSFPFDVAVNSIFGLNQAQLGREYVVQGYNGEKRAKEGLFYGDGDSYWEYLTKNDTMKAGQGYYVIFDNEYVGGWQGHIWDNKGAGSSVYMYFPATDKIAKIDNANITSTVPKHTCTIDRTWKDNKDKNHMNTDSHWNTFGSPLFHNSYIGAFATAVDTALTSYYYLDNPEYGTSPTWMVQAIKDAPMFKAMSAVLVQWAGTITWTTTTTNIFGAPRRATAEDEKKYFIKLDMSYDGELRDWAYVDLREGADTAFTLNEDMCKVNNKGVPNVYTFAGGYDVSYNAAPIQSQTIPVGLIARKNGTYTFSMPYNFSGTVILVDKFDGTRTNLAMEDYEVYLEKGTIDDRFELEINVNKMPTAIDGAEDGSGSLKDGKAHKFIENGVMYILENGRIFDARGNRVK